MGSVGGFTGLLFKAISFYPLPIQLFFGFVGAFFGIFILGRVLKWLWDVLPVA